MNAFRIKTKQQFAYGRIEHIAKIACESSIADRECERTISLSCLFYTTKPMNLKRPGKNLGTYKVPLPGDLGGFVTNTLSFTRNRYGNKASSAA